MAIYISQLDETYPDGSVHKVYVIDDDLRNIKRALKDSFANVSGPVTATHTELNHLVGVNANVQTQIDTLGAARQGILARGKFYGGRVSAAGNAVTMPDGWTVERSSLGIYSIAIPATTLHSVTLNIDSTTTTEYWHYTISLGTVGSTGFGVQVVNANAGGAKDAGFYFHAHTV